MYLTVLGLSCSMQDPLVVARGMQFPHPGPTVLGAWSLSRWTTREVPMLLLYCGRYCFQDDLFIPALHQGWASDPLCHVLDPAG